MSLRPQLESDLYAMPKQPTQSEAIKQVFEAKGDIPTYRVIAILQRQGVVVSDTLVRTVRTKLFGDEAKKRKAGRPSSNKPLVSSSGRVNPVSGIQVAADLADRLRAVAAAQKRTLKAVTDTAISFYLDTLEQDAKAPAGQGERVR